MTTFKKLYKLIEKLKDSEIYEVKLKKHYARVQRKENGVKVFKISVRNKTPYAVFDISLKTRVTRVDDNKFVRITGDFDAPMDDPPVLSSDILFMPVGEHDEEYFWVVPVSLLKSMTKEAEKLLKKVIKLERDGKHFIGSWEPRTLQDYLAKPRLESWFL